MKKLICLFLGLATLLSLAACSTQIDIGQTTNPTVVAPSTINDLDLQAQLAKMNADNIDKLDEAARKRLEAELAAKGVLPSGVTLPAGNQTVKAPSTMPAGNQVKASEVYPLIKSVYDIFQTGKFTFKALGTSPLGGTSIPATPLTMVLDGDKSAFETEIDWSATMKALAEDTAGYNKAIINGATAQTMFGKKMRFVSDGKGSYIVFVDKKTYISAAAMAGEDASSSMNMASDFGDIVVPKSELPKDVASTRVKVDGKEYLCATLDDGQGSKMRYYFIGKDLKRLEIQDNSGETMIFEVLELTGKADASVFKVSDYRQMSLDQLTQLGSSMGALFG